MNTFSTSLITQTDSADLCETALDTTIEVRMWFDAVNEEDRVGHGGNRVKVNGWATFTLPDHNGIHCRQNWHVNIGLRYT